MSKQEETTASTEALGLRDGAREAVPVVLGYLPIGFAYGVVGTAAGLPLWAVVSMSVLVYAGSAQFIAVSLISQGASVAALVATTFLVNVRHLLYSLALSPRLERMSRGRLAWVAAELTDESFVMAARASASRDTRLPFPFVAGLNGVLQVAWVVSSAVGGVLGGFVGDPLALGLDYALIAMFIGLLMLQMRGSGGVIVAGIAGVISLGLHLLGAGLLGIILATVVAGGVGLVWAERR
ncbi:MAG: AzlC family ABC transporter permease [Actinobacteria bacterium]|nr:AzlC family ABC transporter permease [Actinomycetota bacterium]